MELKKQVDMNEISIISDIQISEKGHLNFILTDFIAQKNKINSPSSTSDTNQNSLEIENDEKKEIDEAPISIPPTKKSNEMDDYISIQRKKFFQLQQNQIQKNFEDLDTPLHSNTGKEYKQETQVLGNFYTMKGSKHLLSVDIVESVFIEEEFDLYKKYQMSIHNDSESKVTEQSYSR